jgi:NIPSNAP
MERRAMLQMLPIAAMLPGTAWAEADKPERRGPEPDADTVYELRVYHAAAGKLPELLARFRDHTINLFSKHGIKSVAYWTLTDDPGKSNTLIYLLQHPSRDAATSNWKAFQDDAEWKSVKEKSEENGKLVDKVDSTYMVLTDFSPRLS